MATYTLSPAEFALTVEKLAKVNERAERKGFTGRVSVSGRTETRKDDFGYTYAVVVTEIIGDAPKYNGWEFLAAVDTVGDNFVIRGAAGTDIDNIDRSMLKAGQCQHCNIEKSNRIHTYLVRNESGEFKQVGSTCIRDFLGLNIFPGMILESDVDEIVGGFSGMAREYTPETIVSVACAAVKKFGYVSSQVWERESTRTTVERFLYPASQGQAQKDDLALHAELSPLVDTDKAETIIETLTSAFSDRGGYQGNLYAVLSGDVVTSKHMGIAVSAVIAYDKLVEGNRQAAVWADEKAAREAKAASIDYVGTIGEKITITGIVSKNMVIETMYGFSHLVIVEGDNFVAKMFTTAGWSESDSADVDKTVTLTGTVKAHDEYNGTKQTVLTRAKLVK